MTYKTLLFDLDGTLLNTLDDLWSSVNHALLSFDFPPCSKEHVRKALGNGIRRLIEACVPSTAMPHEVDQVFTTFRQHYLAHSLDTTAPYPGILPMLDLLKERGFRMGMVSNKVDAAVQDLHQRFFKEQLEIALGESESTPPKPNPAGVLRAMEILDAEPRTTLYVGDSEVDHATARAAGVASCLVLWGFRDADTLHSLQADHYLQEPKDLLELLK